MGKELERRRNSPSTWALFIGIFGGAVLGYLLGKMSDYPDVGGFLGGFLGSVLGLVAALVALFVAKVVGLMRSPAGKDGDDPPKA